MKVNVKKVGAFLKKNSPTILAVTACGGTVATAYLSGRNTVKALRTIEETGATGWRDILKVTWKDYLPTAGAVVLTCASILTGDAISRKQKSCLVAATAAATEAYRRLDDAMRKHTSEEEQKEIEREMAQQAVKDGAVRKKAIDIPMGPDENLYYEPHYGYFAATEGELYKALGECNEYLAESEYCTLEQFFNHLGIDDNVTKGLGYLGWHLSAIDDFSGYALIHMRPDEGVPLEPICENCLMAYRILWDTPVIEHPEEYDNDPAMKQFAGLETPADE